MSAQGVRNLQGQQAKGRDASSKGVAEHVYTGLFY